MSLLLSICSEVTLYLNLNDLRMLLLLSRQISTVLSRSVTDTVDMYSDSNTEKRFEDTPDNFGILLSTDVN